MTAKLPKHPGALTKHVKDETWNEKFCLQIAPWKCLFVELKHIATFLKVGGYLFFSYFKEKSLWQYHLMRTKETVSTTEKKGINKNILP